MLIEKANEWEMSLCFLDGDLPKAYDNILHPVIAKRLTRRGFPKFFTAAILRETRRQKITIRMGDILSDPVGRTKSLSQGSSDAPKIFNHVLDEDIMDFANLCRKLKWGFPISQDASGYFDEFLPILVFADNFWIIAKSPEELQIMSSTWFSRCASSGWSIPHHECTWSTTLSDHVCRWALNVGGAYH